MGTAESPCQRQPTAPPRQREMLGFVRAKFGFLHLSRHVVRFPLFILILLLTVPLLASCAPPPTQAEAQATAVVAGCWPGNLATPRAVTVTPNPLLTTPTLAATATTGSIVMNRGGDDAYAMVRAGEDGMMLSGDLDDMNEVKRVRQHLHSDFLWFRHGGDTWVLQDPATLAAARQAWAGAEEIGARMEVLGKQMEPHGARMEALGKKMEALGHDNDPYVREMEALGKRMEPLARQQAELGEKMQALAESRRGEADDARIEAQMAQLQRKMEPLQAQMETLSKAMEAHSAAMQRAQAPMEDLSRQMQEASAPMEALSKQMDALGKRQEPLVKQADAEVKRLIQQALRDGKAVRARDVTR